MTRLELPPILSKNLAADEKPAWDDAMRHLVERFSWPTVVACALASCVQVPSGDGRSVRAAPHASDAGADGQLAYAGCFTDVQSQVVLCESIGTCPGLVVDPGAFPDCGFRLNAGVPIAIDCLCSNALCPLGSTTTCEDARALLRAQNELLVCAQVAEGRCIDLSKRATSTGSPCDKSCAAMCAGDPSCIQLCGC